MLPFKTDDSAFKLFLEKLSLEELQSHMRECILEDRLVELLLELEDEYEAYIHNIAGIEIEGEPEELKPYVEEMFAEADEQDIRWLATNVLCAEFIIELLMESDDDFRWDIMRTSLDWEESLNWKLLGKIGIWLN